MRKLACRSGLASAIVLGALLLGGQTAAATDNAREPWPLTERFETPPPRAHAQPGTACATAERYVELGAAKRVDEIGALFAKDAAFLDPFGTLVQGREAIGAWYRVHGGANTALPVAFTAVGHECFMEVASHVEGDPDPRYNLLVIDHFTMNDQGEIARAVYYFRPGPMAEAVRYLKTRPQGQHP
jgi:hypothetical protein